MNARQACSDGNGFNESSGAARRIRPAGAANSLLRVGGLYKLEAMVGFYDHRLDKRIRNPACLSGAFERKTPVVKG